MTSTSAKKLPVAVGAVLAALIAWLSVSMQGEYSIVKSVPVVFEDMKEGKAFRYPIPRMMSVRLRGKGWVVAGLFFSPDFRYFINLSSIGEEPLIITGKDLQNHVTLPVDVQVMDVRPDTLRLALADYYEKRVPVTTRMVLDFREGYGEVGPVQVSPESVTVGGTLEFLQGVSSWNTAFRRYSDIRAPIEEEIPLETLPNYSVSIPVKTVVVRVNVEPFAEKTFAGIPVNVVGVPPGLEVILIPPRLDIIVRGGIEQLSALSTGSFSAEVPYAGLERDSTGFVVPELRIPGGLKAVERQPARFQFIIRKRL
jgi:YbbR domain-containing protein